MNNPHDSVLLHGEYLDAALELGEIAEAKRDLDAREKRCRDLLGSLLSVGECGVDKDNIPIVAVKAGAARFNPERAIAVLPSDVLLGICSRAPDARVAKQLLSPAMYEDCLEYNNASVVAV